MPSHELADLSHFALARAIMNRLWQKYDAGGISLHRAERAALLESITDCTPIEWRDDSMGEDELIAAAYARPEPSHAFGDNLFPGLRMMPFDQYACLVLDELRMYYAQDLMTEIAPGHFLSIVEKRAVDAIAHLIGARKGAEELRRRGHAYTRAELIKEGWERRRDHTESQNQGTE